MSEQVLYRKYRPRDFTEVVGQEHVTGAIQNAFRTGRVAHAYLFSGPRGVGKTSVARLIAKSLNCANSSKISEGNFDDKLSTRRSVGEGGLPIPCNQCSFCNDFNDGRASDVIEIDAASNRGIDEIRQLREGVRFVPTQGKYKTYIIDECLTADHLITLGDGGVRSIADLKDGDEVLSVDIKTGAFISKKISHWFHRTTDKLVYIRTPQSTLKCTPTHRLWVMRQGMSCLVQAQDIERSDFLMSPALLPHVSRNTFTTEQLAFLALIQCDGHVSKDSATIQVEISKDVQYFVSVFQRGIHAWGCGGNFSVKKTKRGTTLLRYYSPKMKEILVGLHCPAGKKSALIDISDVVFQAPLDSIQAYIDMCFCCEGDAVADFKSGMYKLNFTSVSEVFAKKLQLLMKKFGIGSSLIVINRENTAYHRAYRIGVTGYDLRLFQTKIGLTLKRKAARIRGQLSLREKQDGIPVQIPFLAKRRELQISHRILNAHGIYLDKTQALTRATAKEFIALADVSEMMPYLEFRYEKILSITSQEEKVEVYDFTVDDTHTFVANGLCSSNCHQMTKEAFNALLKTLEEPPAHAVFVLATTDPEKVPATIISRTQHYNFRRPQPAEMADRLIAMATKEGVSLEPDAARLIAMAAEGSFRDAESILGQVMAVEDKKITREEAEEILGLPKREAAKQMFTLVAQKKAPEALALIQELSEAGYDLTYFSKLLMQYFRSALFLKTDRALQPFVTAQMLPDEYECIVTNLPLFTMGELARGVNVIFDNLQRFRRTPIPQLPLELAVIELTDGREKSA